MTFWIYAVLITIATVLAISLPIFRKARQLDEARIGEYAHDVEVYRDQLRELGVESERGLISDEDAKQARTEIARRLLSAQEKAAGEQLKMDDRRRRFGSVVLASTVLIFIPALTFLVYIEVGSPQLPSQPLAPRIAALEDERLAQSQARQQMLTLIERAETHLNANPQDGQGWDVLAPVYFRAGDLPKSVEAYRNAIRILGESSQRLSGLGEALFALSGGVIDAEAAQSFQRALQIDGQNGRALFYDALAKIQRGDSEAGRLGWQALAANPAVQAEWTGAAAEGLRRLDAGDMSQIPGMAQQQSPANGMPQLDAETIEQGQAMQADERNAMIAGMVSRLDERLRENPDDQEGWQRLIQAYVVLGNRDEAQDALNRAIENFSENEQVRATLNSFAASLGLQAATQQE